MNLLLADVVSWASKPSRCLYYITVIPNRHFIPPISSVFNHQHTICPN